MCPQGFVAYELKGESHDAAVELDMRVRAVLSQNPVPYGRSLLDINNDYQARYQAALADVRRDDPALAAKCGLASPTIQVDVQDGAHPRAYHTYPEIFGTSAKAPLYLMFCPVDYKGNHFKPPGAVPVNPTDLSGTDMGHSIYKNLYWVAEGPILDAGRGGVALPADFNAAAAHTIPGHGLRPDRCFRAGAEALQTLEKMAKDKELFDTNWKAMADGIQNWCERNHPGHHVNISLRNENGANVLQISLREQKTGSAVPLNSPDWIINKQIRRNWTNPMTGQSEEVILKEYEVEPNTATKAGCELYNLLKSVPMMPHAQSYPAIEVTSSNGTQKPIVHRFPQGIYLAAHNIPDGEKITPPRGCVEVPPAELIWLDRDRRDREWGVTPPPPPAALAHLFKAAPPPAPRAPQP